MAIICKNCENQFDGNYCNACGQSAATHRISIHFLWHDIKHGLFHFENGIISTAVQLFTRPGHAIREYIAGKRMSLFSPVSLVLVLAGLYGFLAHYFHINMLASSVSIRSSSATEQAALQNSFARAADWIAEHYALVSLLQLPLFAISTFVVFYRRGYNFAEHFVINAFLAAQKIILHLVCFPLYYFLSGKPSLNVSDRVIVLIGFMLMIYTMIQFFNGQNKVRTFFLSLLSIGLFIVFTLIILVLMVYFLEKNVVKSSAGL